MYPRLLEKPIRSSKKSVLLLGPRQTGKSTLIKSLKPDLSINLAHESTYLDFLRNPGELEARLRGGTPKVVFIDEVQRIPSLLNTIQVILDDWSHPPRFLLTGSSARKLKRGQANLLPGRLHSFSMGALVSRELEYDLDTRAALETGTLPGIYSEKNLSERKKTLKGYASTYLKEEIQAEGLTRNLEGFARFLSGAAACSGGFLDFSKLSSEAQVPRQSVVRYFEILEDTLIVQRCLSFAKSERKRLIQHPRYFFFDNGVLNGLLLNFVASDDRKGLLFEQLVFNQIQQAAASLDLDYRISTYRTEHGAEVDFIVELEGEIWAIEVKASSNVGQSDLNGLKSFRSYYSKRHRPVVAYLGTASKRIDEVQVLPWQELLKQMGL